MKTEEKILDYMDGTLSESESGELLHSLSVSPEKRVVLEQHIKLRELTGLAQKPYAVPQALESRLAERIPALAEYNRDLAGGAVIIRETAGPSFIGRMAASLAGLIAQYPVRTGFALAAASVIGYFALRTSDVKQDLAQVPVQHQQVSTPAQSPSPASPVSPNQNSSVAPTNSNVATSSEASSASSDRNFASARVRHEKQSNTNSDRSAVDHHASHSQHAATPPAKVETPAENVADNQNPIVTPPAASKEKNDATDNSSKDNSVKENAPKAVAEKNTPPAPSAQNAPKDMASNDESVGSHEKNPLRDREEGSSSRFPFAVRVYGSLGGSLVNVHANDATLANHIEGAALLGLDYIIDPKWSVGVEGGNAAISQLISQSSLQSNVGGLPSISRVVVSNAVSNGSQFYARGVIRYTFNPQDRIHFEGSGGVGAAFMSSFAPLVSAAFYAGYDLNRNFAISAGLAFAGTWASAGTPNAAAQAVAAQADPIGYVTVNHASATLFTPSYGLRIGLKFRP